MNLSPFFVLNSLLLLQQTPCPSFAAAATTTLLDERERIPLPIVMEKSSRRIPDIAPQVETSNGVIRGKAIRTSRGKELYAFFGIPYGQPPVGELRFKPPLAAKPWNTPFEAYKLPNSCSQPLKPGAFANFAGDMVWYPNTNVSEDCLYLNIWVTPSIFEQRVSLTEDESSKSFKSPNATTMLWIHGGALFFGTSTSDVFQAHNLAAEEEVIVVSIQYRVGPIGFLYLGTEDAPGNVGLLDQALALNWVQENIKLFGGDSDKVTIFGESAGGASVIYHLLSPVSRTLFNSGIIMSGTYESRFQHAAGALNTSMTLAWDVGCANDPYHSTTSSSSSSDSNSTAAGASGGQPTPKEIVECLQKVDASKLVAHQMDYFHKPMRSPFVATVDGKFLTDTPVNLLTRGDPLNLKRANVMIGNCKDEGTFFLPSIFSKQWSAVKPVFISHEEFLYEMKDMYQDKKPYEVDAILNYYTNWDNLDDGYANQLKIADAVGDSFLICPGRFFADSWSSMDLDTYYYDFTQRTSSSPWGAWYGVRHTDEIEYALGRALDDGKHTKAEIELSRRIMKFFANFAKTGYPSPTREWKRYTKARPVFIELNANLLNSTTDDQIFGPRPKECGFWNSYLPKLRKSFNQELKKECDGGATGGGSGSLTHPHPVEVVEIEMAPVGLLMNSNNHSLITKD